MPIEWGFQLQLVLGKLEPLVVVDPLLVTGKD
jgi:hypothetical protein